MKHNIKTIMIFLTLSIYTTYNNNNNNIRLHLYALHYIAFGEYHSLSWRGKTPLGMVLEIPDICFLQYILYIK